MIDTITALDFNIVLWVQQHVRSPFLSAFFIPFTTIGNAGILFILIGVLLLFFKRTRQSGILLLISLTISFILNDIVVKNIVQRPRPFNAFSQIVPLVPPPGKYSFPSGHTAAAFSSMVTFFFTQRKYAICGLVIALLMGISRIYVGVHYPTDVFFGALLGTAVAVTSAIIFLKTQHKEI